MIILPRMELVGELFALTPKNLAGFVAENWKLCNHVSLLCRVVCSCKYYPFCTSIFFFLGAKSHFVLVIGLVRVCHPSRDSNGPLWSILYYLSLLPYLYQMKHVGQFSVGLGDDALWVMNQPFLSCRSILLLFCSEWSLGQIIFFGVFNWNIHSSNLSYYFKMYEKMDKLYQSPLRVIEMTYFTKVFINNTSLLDFFINITNKYMSSFFNGIFYF